MHFIVNPSDAEAGAFREHYVVNNMAVDAVATCVTKAS